MADTTTLSPYVLCAISAFILLMNMGVAVFFVRMKKKVMQLTDDAVETKAKVLRHGASKNGNYIVYGFTTNMGEEKTGYQNFPYRGSLETYPEAAQVSVLYVSENPSISCLKNELHQKLKTAQALGLISVIIPISGVMIVAVLWLVFTQNHLLKPF